MRELENAIERAVVLTSRSRIDIDDLPGEVGLAVPDVVVSTEVRPLADVERDYIMLAAIAARPPRNSGLARPRSIARSDSSATGDVTRLCIRRQRDSTRQS